MSATASPHDCLARWTFNQPILQRCPILLSIEVISVYSYPRESICWPRMSTAEMKDHDRKPKTFVLCFDGTGNKFSGTEADSNILKIYRMLDRSGDQVFTYYQPGIGTYITSGDLDHTSIADRIGSWYIKAKDSAIGTSFADHVMGGYKFLMRFYTPGDDIYMFGFSRGSYIARYASPNMHRHVSAY